VKKVFVVNDSGHDLSDATRFGELVVMTVGDVPKYHCTKWLREFMGYLEGSSPEDYILQSGPSTVNSIACCVFVHLHGRLNLLLYTGEQYVEQTLVFKREEVNGVRV